MCRWTTSAAGLRDRRADGLVLGRRRVVTNNGQQLAGAVTVTNVLPAEVVAGGAPAIQAGTQPVLTGLPTSARAGGRPSTDPRVHLGPIWSVIDVVACGAQPTRAAPHRRSAVRAGGRDGSWPQIGAQVGQSGAKWLTLGG
jgi:hypothetical protein